MSALRRMISFAVLAAFLAAITAGVVQAKDKTRAKPQCVVPQLAGDTLVQARVALATAHCKLGKVSEPKGVKGTLIVSSEAPKARSHGRSGLPVALTMKAKAGTSSTPVNTAPTRTVTLPAPPAQTVTVTTPAPPAVTVTVTVPETTPPPPSAVSLGGTQTVYDFAHDPLQVTASLIDPAMPANSFEAPTSGDRLIGVKLVLSNPGTAAVSDDANNDTAIVGSDDQEYEASLDSLSGCTNFDFGAFTLQPGASLTGCVAFELPSGTTVKSVQFELGDDGDVAVFDT